ncbi:MAG: 50S ribosomal protein L9 [Planctomycetes bacterium]|nr:50S ribosomal protein L9 [Planctomycetota bacterium]MCB9905755.1 50S ribosomal protein L9 [Planctomycetota bacterium]
MKDTEVLLREHVENLGRCGDVVRVKPGFARNYLLPQRLAVTANEDNKKMVERRRVRLEAEEAAMAADIAKRVELLASVALTTVEKADENGHLYGSVTAARIAELLAAAGHAFEERDVRLEKPLKAVGSHEVEIHVHGDQSATITLEITAEA